MRLIAQNYPINIIGLIFKKKNPKRAYNFIGFFIGITKKHVRRPPIILQVFFWSSILYPVKNLQGRRGGNKPLCRSTGLANRLAIGDGLSRCPGGVGRPSAPGGAAVRFSINFIHFLWCILIGSRFILQPPPINRFARIYRAVGLQRAFGEFTFEVLPIKQFIGSLSLQGHTL